MDKIEFKEKYEEIKQLQKQGRYEEAIDIAENINWRKVQNVNALVRVSEICEEAGRLEQARELLYVAHERSPIGRMILYHLAMLCVKMGDLDEAMQHYEAFVEIAPHDSLKYIIKYTINKAKGADNAALIAILEELKDHEFLEEWSYELAYLYHKTMQINKCIELCDELILWFGEGPYVERALEMKMIYQPLDKMQEDKYRHFQQKREGITEIVANEALRSGEIVSKTVAIPQVELPPERFNTINLQAEIKRNIDEIMKATEEEAVSENMENIKSLVEEIPYLQITENEEEIALKQQQANEELDATVKDTFKEYLAEEYDGQMSLLVPEHKEVEEQIQGQMTIEDAIAEWEKMQRAAEATLQDVQQQKLESAKNIALLEVGQIMDRLEEAIPKLDAGATATDLLKEEYMAKATEEEEPKETAEPKEENLEVFQIPKVEASGVDAGVGLEIPVVSPEDEHIIKEEKSEEAPVITKSEEQKDTKEWQPPVLEEEEQVPETESSDEEVTTVDMKEASKIVEDMNNMLQKEIDRILQNESAQEIEVVSEEVEIAQEPIPEEVEPEQESNSEEQELDEKLEVEDIEEPAEEVLPEIQEVVLEPEEMAALVDEHVLEQAIREEIPTKVLTEEEKDIFSYFIPINGMESSICQVLTGAKTHLETKTSSSSGNIIILGGEGSGKTMLASNLIKVLQNETGKVQGSIGKIDAGALNQKDIATLMNKVNDGCLIVEDAGALEATTMESMRQFMAQSNSRVLVILEGDRQAVEKALSKNTAFATMFTEKISIPVFTIDELVNFGKVYAFEEGYIIDEMGVLALYNRINLIQHVDRATSLTEVQEIVEEAIDRAERGGLFAAFSRLGSKRYDENGNLILREQDFEA